MAVRPMWTAAATLGGLIALLPASPAMAYTIKRTQSGAIIHWERQEIPVELGPGLAAHPDAEPALAIALEAWEGVAGPLLIRSEGDLRATTVDIESPWPFPAQRLAVTVTQYDPRSGRIIDSDVAVNADYPFSLIDDDPSPATPYDLGALLSHELGHVLGLGESHDEPQATMWPRIARGDVHQRTIEDDDRAGIEEAYAGVALVPDGGCGGARVGVAQPAHVSPKWWLVGLLLGVAALWGYLRFQSGSVYRGRPRRRPNRGPAMVVVGAIALLAWPFPSPSGQPEPSARLRAAAVVRAFERPIAERNAVVHEALRDPDRTVRIAALGAIVAHPRRVDLDALETMPEEDGLDALIRQARAAARRAPPSRIVSAQDAVGHLIDAHLLELGRVVRVESTQAFERTGVIPVQTELQWVDADGASGTLTVLGGCTEDICVDVGSAPPAADEEMLIVPQSGAWARYHDQQLFDGWVAPNVTIALR